jgi:hypothetical protein
LSLDDALHAGSLGEVLHALDPALPSAANLPASSLLARIWALPVQLGAAQPSAGAYEWRSAQWTGGGCSGLVFVAAYRVGDNGPGRVDQRRSRTGRGG